MPRTPVGEMNPANGAFDGGGALSVFDLFDGAVGARLDDALFAHYRIGDIVAQGPAEQGNRPVKIGVGQFRKRGIVSVPVFIQPGVVAYELSHSLGIHICELFGIGMIERHDHLGLEALQPGCREVEISFNKISTDKINRFFREKKPVRCREWMRWRVVTMS